MSIRIADDPTQRYSATTGLPPADVFTVTCWVYLVNSRATYSTIWALGDATGFPNARTELTTDADGTTLTLVDSVVTFVGSFAATTGVWWRVAAVVNGASATLYAAPAGSALTSASTSSFAPNATPTLLAIGADGPASSRFDGRLAAFKMWQAALTATEVADELAQFDPIRGAGLLRYHPFHVAEQADYSGNGNTLAPAALPPTTEVDPPISGLPTFVSDRGATADATAATTTTVTLTSPTSIAVGAYLIARVAVDNSGTNGAAPGCTVTDPRSNTWTVLGPALVDPGVAAAGATAYLCYARVATAYQAADALTFNWGGISTTAKAIVVEEWANIDRAAPVAVSAVTATGTASTAVTAAITPTGAYQLVYTCLATEGIAGDTITYDADTTNGTWATLTRTASANATATNNQCVAGQYKVVTTGGAQSWDATITNRDWAAVAVVFSPPRLKPKPLMANQSALVRAASW